MKYSILIFDDNFEILSSLDRVLSKKYYVETALTTDEFIEKLDKEFTIYIIDYHLYDQETGIVFAQKIKEKYPLSRTIILTGDRSTVPITDAINSNVVDSFLAKPVRNKELFEYVEQNIRDHEKIKSDFDKVIQSIRDGTMKNIKLLSEFSTHLLNYLYMSLVNIKHLEYNSIALIISRDNNVIFKYDKQKNIHIIDYNLYCNFLEIITALNYDIFSTEKHDEVTLLKTNNLKFLIKIKNKIKFNLIFSDYYKKENEINKFFNKFVFNVTNNIDLNRSAEELDQNDELNNYIHELIQNIQDTV